MIGSPETIVLTHDPACDEGATAMEFRLTYEGELLGASRNDTRAKHKQQIRKVFHKQLKRLFELHPAYAQYQYEGLTGDPRKMAERYYFGVINNFERAGYHFFPLTTRYASLLCSIEILFLRPDVPGAIIRSGDIDNRLKTIFDALRLPHDRAELGGYNAPADDEDPFFCLLEDDSLISHASVETDTLLQPTGQEWRVNDARLVITVRLRPYRVTFDNLAFS
jgi:hypothetical protein